MAARRSLPIEQYKVGVVCTLPHEMTTAIAILDERHQWMAGQDKLDYVLGKHHTWSREDGADNPRQMPMLTEDTVTMPYKQH
jgi:hypothetical protein